MFEFLGLKLRDTVRTWMSAKAKDRAALRRFEKDFLYRQIDIRNYADDQFTGLLDLIAERMIERHISTFKPLMKHGAEFYKVPPERALECIVAAFTHEEEPPCELSAGEMIFRTIGLAGMDTLLQIHMTEIVFALTRSPILAHMDNPEITDDQLDALLQNEEFREQMSPDIGWAPVALARGTVKCLRDAYGLPLDDKQLQDLFKEAGQPQIPPNTDHGVTPG